MDQILTKYVIKLKSIKFKMAKKHIKPTNQLEKSEKTQAFMNQKCIRKGYEVDKELLTRLTISWNTISNHLHGCKNISLLSMANLQRQTPISSSTFPFPAEAIASSELIKCPNYNSRL